jgi:tetratricopeptide (TPR) repeat protein
MALRLLLATVLLTSLAHAADQPVSPEAKRHVDLGVEQYNGGHYEEAVKEFELAYRLSNRPALLFNIARAEAKLGHDEAAIAFLRRYLEERPNAPDAPAVRAEIEAHEETLAAAKARTQAEQQAAKASEQAARAEHEAAEARRKTAELTAEQHKEELERQQQEEAQRAAAARQAAERDRHATLKNAGIGLLVGGAVVVVTGAALGGVAAKTASDVSGKTGEFGDCCRDLERRGQLSSQIGIAFDVIGAAAAASGIGLLVWSGRKKEQTHVWLTPSPGGIALAGSFR